MGSLVAKWTEFAGQCRRCGLSLVRKNPLEEGNGSRFLFFAWNPLTGVLVDYSPVGCRVRHDLAIRPPA